MIVVVVRDFQAVLLHCKTVARDGEEIGTFCHVDRAFHNFANKSPPIERVLLFERALPFKSGQNVRMIRSAFLK